MTISFLLHLYQPSFQDENSFRKIYEQCYSPLIKFIKQSKDFNVTINIPLSLLEKMDVFGYQSWLADVKSLVDVDRVELTGSGAYHPLLTKVPKEHAELQIILNEYAQGYYFGRHNGFEGEKAILIKDLNGFFSPELALNSELLTLLNELSYKWALADETCLYPQDRGGILYKVGDHETLVVARNRDISNYFAFKRDYSCSDLILPNGDVVIALDGESFGHHNKHGIRLLDNFYNTYKSRGYVFHTVSHLLHEANFNEVVDIKEATWGASDVDMENGLPYPMWVVSDNTLQTALWELQTKVLLALSHKADGEVLHNEYSNIPLWYTQESVKHNDYKFNLGTQLCKIANSDQFWWISGAHLFDGTILYSPELVKLSLKEYDVLLQNLQDNAAVAALQLALDAIKMKL